MQKQMVKKMQEKFTEVSAKNLLAGQQFLAKNAKETGVVTLPSGLQYKIITPGTGDMPTANDTVTVNYEGKLIDGTVFDSSYKRGQPATFKVGQVIKGWQEALKLMKPGATWMLYIPAELAYGPQGSMGAIGPNETLIFKVDLISVKKA
jgi:FKBP-type peptidyl-prolyl cis-trans isomerase FklB